MAARYLRQSRACHSEWIHSEWIHSVTLEQRRFTEEYLSGHFPSAAGPDLSSTASVVVLEDARGLVDWGDDVGITVEEALGAAAADGSKTA